METHGKSHNKSSGKESSLLEPMPLTQLHISKWRSQYAVTDAINTDIFRANAEHLTQGVEDVQEHTKQRIAQEGLTSAPHVRGRIELRTEGARPGKSRRNRQKAE